MHLCQASRAYLPSTLALGGADALASQLDRRGLPRTLGPACASPFRLAWLARKRLATDGAAVAWMQPESPIRDSPFHAYPYVKRAASTTQTQETL